MWTKQEKRAMDWWVKQPRKEQIRMLAEVILRDNNRIIANGIMGKELNDIEFQQFKRYIRREL